MDKKDCKIIFFGTPDVSVKILEDLLNEGYDIPLVITAPDKPVGRKHVMTPPPVKVFAESKNIEVYQPLKLDTESLNKIKDTGADVGIVVAYGYIIPQNIIDIFSKGLLNIHYSLLPDLRGASPVENTILQDKDAGVTIQKLVFKLDAGPIIAQESISRDDSVTTPELKDKLTRVGSELLLEVLPKYLSGEIDPKEQDESKATHCGKISKSDGEIKLEDPDDEKWRKYRAYFGWPGIFYFDEDGKRVKITEAKLEGGKFIIKKIIPEGRKEIST